MRGSVTHASQRKAGVFHAVVELPGAASEWRSGIVMEEEEGEDGVSETAANCGGSAWRSNAR